jgi:hypothetical protein
MVPRCPRFLIVTCIVCLSLGSRSVQASPAVQLANVEPQPKPFWSSSWFLAGVGASTLVGAMTLFALRQRQSSVEISEKLLLPAPRLALPSSKGSLNLLETNETKTINSNGSSYHDSNETEIASILVTEPRSQSELETTKLSRINIVEELILNLRNSDPGKRHKVIWEIGQRGDSRAVQPLVDLLVESDSKQRSLILSSLSEIGTRTLKPMTQALAISLQDENAEVRKNAIRDLTRVYDFVAQISSLLHKATNDPDQEVQETAHWALAQLNRIRSVPELPRLANSVSPPEKLP